MLKYFLLKEGHRKRIVVPLPSKINIIKTILAKSSGNRILRSVFGPKRDNEE